MKEWAGGGRACQQLPLQKEKGTWQRAVCLRSLQLVTCPRRPAQFWAFSSGPGMSSLLPRGLCPPSCLYLFIYCLLWRFLSIQSRLPMLSQPSPHPHPHPRALSHPAVCAALCLSVTRKIKNSKRQDLCVCGGGVSGWGEEEEEAGRVAWGESWVECHLL